MFYRLNEDGSILDYSATKYSDECLFTELPIIVAWDNLSYIAGTEPAEPIELQEEKTRAHLNKLTQYKLDFDAKALGYDDCKTACTYIDTGVLKFDAEGAAFRKWRSAAWDYCYKEAALILRGEKVMPTDEEFIANLPKLEIQYA